MGRRAVRRPTEDKALNRVTAWEKTQPTPTCNHERKIMDIDGTMYLTWFFHTKLNLGIDTLWDQWHRDWRAVSTFIEFLTLSGTIYRFQKIS